MGRGRGAAGRAARDADRGGVGQAGGSLAWRRATGAGRGNNSCPIRGVISQVGWGTCWETNRFMVGHEHSALSASTKWSSESGGSVGG